MTRILATFFTSFGIFCLVATFVPDLQIKWEGSHKKAGSISHLGFGLTFILFLLNPNGCEGDPTSTSVAIAGFILVIAGKFRDSKLDRCC